MNRILTLLIFSLLVCLWSCEDDFPYPDQEIPEGTSTVKADVSFKSFTAAGLSRADGEAIQAIESLWVVLFNTDGEFIDKIKIDRFTVKDVRPNERPDGKPQSDAATGHAEFDLTLKNGKYRIYAVANCDLSSRELSTEDDLRNINLTWNNDPSKVTENAEMFGFFTDREDDKSALSSFSASTVAIRGNNQTLHGWVRRAASKLTIVYDGRNLKDNVVIYIKSATIKDIPINCPLGNTNRPGNSTAKPGEPDPTDGIDPASVLYPQGETIKYYPGDTEPDDNSLLISSYEYALAAGKTDTLGTHNTDEQALFFYENVQPEGLKGTITDKRQDVSGNNTQISYPDGSETDDDGKPTSTAWKDGRRYGTYVEVKAFYSCDVEGKRSRGDIIYRFMLGKNITTDYTAERNHHYKLTMKFNGYANDVDFHIDYNIPEPSVHIQPYFISYLYNHSMMYPVTVHAGHNKVINMTAEIVRNRWSPEGAGSDVYYSDGVLDDPDNYQWNGFLSLRKTKDTRTTGNSATTFLDKNGKTLYSAANFVYYYEHLRHRREYSDMTAGRHVKDMRESDPDLTGYTSKYSGVTLNNVKPKDYKEATDDEYVVDIEYDKEDPQSKIYNIKIPMYTRAKQLIKSSAYTGNNPYVSYQRKALVRVSVLFEDEFGKRFTISEEAPITQVRRIVNPKGIYRKAGSTSPFHVTLRYLESEDATEFVDLRSEGSWRAYVIAGNAAILNLDGKQEVGGKAGSKIDFNVNFTGVQGQAVIRIDYHNYSCNHIIFCRNGYEPTQLVKDGAKWHNTNLRTANQEADNPMDEGSLFRYGQLDYPIDASSNVNDKNPWTLPPNWSWFHDSKTEKLNIAVDGNGINTKPGTGGADPEVIGPKTWEEIKPIWFEDGTFDKDKKITVKGRIADMNDYRALFDCDDIEYGYGILYADGATQCAKHITAAYGYRHDRTEYNKEKCGMRGVFIYNAGNGTLRGNNIFLPIGNSGFGFRRANGYKQGGDPDDNPFKDWHGVLRYAGRNDFYPEEFKSPWGTVSSVKMRPLFYDLWRRPGAIYWLDHVTTTDLNLGDGTYPYLAWDVNYFTFDFYGMLQSDVHYAKDKSPTGAPNSGAAFVRMVE